MFSLSLLQGATQQRPLGLCRGQVLLFSRVLQHLGHLSSSLLSQREQHGFQAVADAAQCRQILGLAGVVGVFAIMGRLVAD